MDNQGFIKLHRKILESNIWNAQPTKLKMFLYFILKANHSNHGRYKRGEHITSYEIMQKDLDMSSKTIAKNLQWLKDEGYITVINGTGIGTHIKINNYDSYQSEKSTEVSLEKVQTNKNDLTRMKDIITGGDNVSKSTKNPIEFRTLDLGKRTYYLTILYMSKCSEAPMFVNKKPSTDFSKIRNFLKKQEMDTLAAIYDYVYSIPDREIMDLSELFRHTYRYIEEQKITADKAKAENLDIQQYESFDNILQNLLSM